MDLARLRAFALLFCACLEGMQRAQSHSSRALFCVVVQKHEEPPPTPAGIFSLPWTCNPFSLPYHVLMDAAAHQQISFHFSIRDL